MEAILEPPPFLAETSAANPPANVLTMRHSLAAALLIAERRARRSGASTLAPSGRRVWVAPSRARHDLYFVFVTTDAPAFAALPDWPVERVEGIAALRSRLTRGGLSFDDEVWEVEGDAGEPPPVLADGLATPAKLAPPVFGAPLVLSGKRKRGDHRAVSAP